MANVIIVGTSLGSTADEGGRFVIRDLEPGTYQVRASYVGYRTFVHDDIVVAHSRSTTALFNLQPADIQMKEVSVVGGYFQKPSEQVVSIRTLSAQEIRRSPGSAEDIFRVMQSLPGVATAGGKSAH